MKYIVFLDKAGNELASYTAQEEFAGERSATIELLASEKKIPVEEITAKEEER